MDKIEFEFIRVNQCSSVAKNSVAKSPAGAQISTDLQSPS